MSRISPAGLGNRQHRAAHQKKERTQTDDDQNSFEPVVVHLFILTHPSEYPHRKWGQWCILISRTAPPVYNICMILLAISPKTLRRFILGQQGLWYLGPGLNSQTRAIFNSLDLTL
jgi:hypothetical protein